ncbi:MAG: MFS transporter, partial [Pseudomonadota bacterium]
SAANVGAYLLGTLLVAWATSRFRLLHIMRLGLFLATSGLFLVSIASLPSVLAIGLFVTGIGGALVWIPAPAIAADALPPQRRGMAVGLISSGMGLGIVFISMLSGTLRSSHGDQVWSSMYQIQFTIAVVVLVATILLVRHQQASPSGGAGFGGFVALQRMRGWLPLILAYSTFGFMYLLVIGFLTTRLEDDSAWAANDAAFAFTIMGFAMILGGPAFVAIAHRFSIRWALTCAFALWPIFVSIVLMGLYLPTLAACIGVGLLFSAIPTLMTLYVVENTTAQDYGPSFAAATLAFGIAQTISPPVGGLLADFSGSFTLVFLLACFMGVVGMITSLQLPKRT